MLAVPALAGSAAYGVSEAFGWPTTLEAKAPDAVRFYGIIAGATIVALALGYTQIDPFKMLVWSALLNGIVAVPIIAVMMVVVTRPSVMIRFSAKPVLGFSDGPARDSWPALSSRLFSPRLVDPIAPIFQQARSGLATLPGASNAGKARDVY